MTAKKIPVLLLSFMFLFAAGCEKDEPFDYTGGGGSNYNIDSLTDAEKLKNIYAGKFEIGNIVNQTYMTGNHFKYLTTHYNTVTCENDMKPSNLAPSSGSYTFSTADAQVDAMRAAGLRVHGHTLVWHMQTPSWLTTGNASVVQANMESYITDVMNHFKGKVTSWDVVNEAMKDQGLSNYQDQIMNQGKWKEYLRNTTDSDGNAASPWFQSLGANYIYAAFKKARAVDQDAVLYYNDYGLNGTYKPRAVYNMIKEINEDWARDSAYDNRKLIEGIGMQGHYNASWMNTDAGFDRLKGNIEKFLELGIRVDISELDIAVGSDEEGTDRHSTMTDADATAQAQAYAKLFRTLIELDALHPNQITRVTMWGIDDKNSWKSKGNPCLFDGNLKPKKAYYAVVDPDSY